MEQQIDPSRRLADRFIFWLSVLVSIHLVLLTTSGILGIMNVSYKFMIGLAISTLINWTFFFLHRTHLFSRTFSTHGTAFICLLLIVFLCFYNPIEFSEMWVLFLLYPVIISFFLDKKLYLLWSTISYVFYAMFLFLDQYYMEHSSNFEQLVFAWGSFALGSYMVGWIILTHLIQIKESLSREGEENNKKNAFRMLHSLIPIVERKSQTSAKEIEETYALMKRVVQKYPEESVADWELQLISLAHYVSRIKWPDYVFEKQGKLTSYEYEIVQEHCFIARDLFGDYASYKRVIDAINFHHERFDGTGYPFQLKGEAIPLLAQILGIVESYLAMTTARAYREALTPEEAFKEIQSMAGQGFQQHLVDVLQSSLAISEEQKDESKVTHLVG
ncbi:HD-GYP domain-containing protein [Brevibacillus sp. SYSU BS000544]|uniref:HD-GYP domain-containing protein n=1 Tax=Brevibacillus sp. SYSU BS000544 TaxID=3416443 RepID=UPI003CE57CCF